MAFIKIRAFQDGDCVTITLEDIENPKPGYQSYEWAAYLTKGILARVAIATEVRESLDGDKGAK